MPNQSGHVSVFGTHTVLRDTLSEPFDWVHHDDGLYVFNENANDIIEAINSANIRDEIDYVVLQTPPTDSDLTGKVMYDFDSDTWVPFE